MALYLLQLWRQGEPTRKAGSADPKGAGSNGGEIAAMTFLGSFVDILFNVLWLAILARVLVSWLPNLPRNQLVVFIFDITEPILAPLRRWIPPLGGMIDLSPMIAMLLLWVLRQIVLSGLSTLG